MSNSHLRAKKEFGRPSRMRLCRLIEIDSKENDTHDNPDSAHFTLKDTAAAGKMPQLPLAARDREKKKETELSDFGPTPRKAASCVKRHA